MKNEKNLKLDQERLVRLQADQVEAAIGGADGNGSVTIVIDVPILKNGGGGTSAPEHLDRAEGSCCKKSC